MSDGSILTKLSEALREKLLDRRPPPQKFNDGGKSASGRPDLLFLQARSMARSGSTEMALKLFDDAIALAPDFLEAIEARAELLDMSGREEQAGAGYAQARRLKSAVRQGPPDRPFAVRMRGNFTSEVVSYDNVVRSLQKNVLPYLARGNAHLACGDARKALIDYDHALKVKPGLMEATALRAEALLRLGRYDEALAAIDAVISSRSDDAEALNTRAVILMGLARLDAANADLNRQLALLPSSQPAARGCVALRLTAYEVAAADFASALLKQPGDAYWQLYHGVAEIRLGRAVVRDRAPDEGQVWPQLLLAFQSGQVGEGAVIALADSDDRRAEAWFQFGVCTIGRDRETARRHWQNVVDHGAPALIEHAAARNELARG